MEYLLHFVLGIFATYLGLLAPGMLNMTAVQITIDKGTKFAHSFSAGASLIVFGQAGIALFFTTYLNKHPNILEFIENVGVFVFFALAILFFMKTRSKVNFRKERKKRKGTYFFRGVLMSTMNMLGIPFYLVISTYLGTKGLLLMGFEYILIFIIGTMFGAYLIFATYISFAKIIIKRANFIARNINYILSLLFLFLGIYTLVK